MNKNLIELYENTNQSLNASIDKITVEIIDKWHNHEAGQVIVMSGCSPLAGTTTVSISLAIAMAGTGRRTLLVDCDVRKSDKYKKLNDNIHDGLANYLSSQNNFVESIDGITYETNISNLKYTPCGKSTENPTRVLCSDKMNTYLDQARRNFDCVILDFPSTSVVPDAQIFYGKCDGIIYISALGETKKSQIKDSRRLVDPFKEKYYGMIINKTPIDQYKSNVKDFDYYLLDKNGHQKFENFLAYKRKNKKNKEVGAIK